MTNVPRLETGNAIADGSRGWFVGSFMPQESLAHSNDVEVKWAIHPEGHERAEWSPASSVRTITVLVRGHLRSRFLIDGEERVVDLMHEGDSVTWENVAHTWKALKDTVTLSVRWKPTKD